jgi:hypothetical protein
MNSPRIAHLAGAFLLVGALSGCGSDNPLSSNQTDSSPPSPPTNLRYTGSVLTWNPSPDADVVGYDVEADLDDPPVTFVRISPQLTAGTSFDLVSRGEYVNTWYRVRAVDVDGNRSLPTNRVFVTVAVTAGAPMPGDPGVVNESPLKP